MNDLELTKAVENIEVGCLTTQQIGVVLGAGPGAAMARLNRLVSKGVLVRVARGLYALPDADVLAVASSMVMPSYISMMAAFEHHGTTTQTPRVIDVVNPVRSGRSSLVLESGTYMVRFVKVPASHMFGITKAYRGRAAAMVAEKEKAVIDGLMLPRYAPLDETADCIRDGVDRARLITYADRTGRQSVIKRAGYLLSDLGYDIAPSDFEMGLSGTYVPLDPAFPRKGKHVGTWKIIVNRVV